MKFILEKNSQRKSELDHTVGLNKFADLSNEEFKEMYMSKVKGPRSNELKMGGVKRNMTVSSRTCNAPTSLDWRDKGVVTPIKDQGQCGKHLIHCIFLFVFIYDNLSGFILKRKMYYIVDVFFSQN